MALLLATAGGGCLRRGDPPLLSENESTCVSAGNVLQAPTYDTGVSRILETNCATCHGDVRRYGAPDFFRLDVGEETRDLDRAIFGARQMAGCVCVSAVQAEAENPLRQPPVLLQSPLCESDRLTLRNWVNREGPSQVDGGTGQELCRDRDGLRCITPAGAVPETPSYEAHVRPIVEARCNTCHGSPRCFEARPQGHVRLDVETVERIGCPGDTPADAGLCADSQPVRVVERAVGLFEYRGEVVRSAVDRLDRGANLIGPMPYQPPHRGAPIDLLPELCDRDRDVLRSWAAAGRRTGSPVALPTECITETVPSRPTWRLDAKRILAARCGLCHGEHNRAGLDFRLDAHARATPDDPPGLSDPIERCGRAGIADGGEESYLLPLLGRTFSIPRASATVVPGSCEAGLVRLRMKVADLVRAIAIDGAPPSMPLGADRNPPARASLCENDRMTLLRWRDSGLPLE